MRKRTTPTAAAVLAAGALLGCLAASGRLAVAQHKVGQPNAATQPPAGAVQDGGNVWWPQFRGPNSSGLGEGRPPVHFGPDQNVLWKTAVGAGMSSPIIWQGRIFLTEFEGATRQLATVCIDRRSGKILWRRTLAPEQIEKVHAISSPAAATPATDGERVYVYFGSYGLVCYDLDGNQKWERRLPLPENPYGTAASPILAGGCR